MRNEDDEERWEYPTRAQEKKQTRSDGNLGLAEVMMIGGRDE